MMIKAELQEWLDTLPPDAQIGINDGGMCLETLDSRAYLEIGAMPEEPRCEHCGSTTVTTQDNGAVVCEVCGHEQTE